MNNKSIKVIAGIIVGYGLLYGFFQLQASLTKPKVHWLDQPYKGPEVGVVLKDKTYTFKDVKGKVLMIDFWATWCSPCVKSVPFVEEIYQRYKDKGLEVWGLAMEVDGGTNIERFVQSHGMHYKAGMPDNMTRAYGYKCESIPKIVLIDKKGMVRYEFVGFDPQGNEELAIAIDVLLAEN